MFRIIRTLIILAVTFVTGVMFERGNMRELCEAGSGNWTGEICLGSEQTP
ncbi:MAG: hypothetical protein ABJI45_13945 [Paracoccaceae bacterium]